MNLSIRKSSHDSKAYLAFSHEASVSVIDLGSDSVVSKVQDSPITHSESITALAFEDGLIGSVDTEKKLILWEVKDCDDGAILVPINSTTVRKKAVSLHFHSMFGTKIIVVGMNNGEVGAFPAVAPSENENKMKTLYKTLVTHSCSMITTVAFSTNGNFLLTGDRDEQVRVTHFPRTHLIHSFCLGHTAFVTCVLAVPFDDNYILSSSGDGSIRCFNIAEGKEVLCFDAFDLEPQSSRLADGAGSSSENPLPEGIVVREIVAAESQGNVKTSDSCDFFVRFDGTNTVVRFKMEKTGEKISELKDMVYLKLTDLQSLSSIVALQSVDGTVLCAAGMSVNKESFAVYKYEINEESKGGNGLSGKLIVSKARNSTANSLSEGLYKGMQKNNHKRKIDVLTLP